MRHLIALATLSLALPSACASTGSAASPAKAVDGVLVGANGMTPYVFDRDSQGAGKSVCNGPCAANWPPLCASESDKASGDYSNIVHDDGRKQWAFRGKPLYCWVKDDHPGDRTGDGVNQVWHTARPQAAVREPQTTAVDEAKLQAQIPGLRRYARALVGDPWAADDLVQDTLERACSRWHLWRAGTDLRAWLVTVMHNLHAHQVRSARLRPAARHQLDLKAAAPELIAPDAGTDSALDLQRCLMRLPEDQRVVLLLVTLEGRRRLRLCAHRAASQAPVAAAGRSGAPPVRKLNAGQARHQSEGAAPPAAVHGLPAPANFSPGCAADAPRRARGWRRRAQPFRM
ncbi:MAG: hypothetical protein Fur0019_08340 [Tibeticola sp.]